MENNLDVKPDEGKKIKILSIEEIEKEWPNWNDEQRRECCTYQRLTLDFLKAHADEVYWPEVSINPQTMAGEEWYRILDKFPNKISWISICMNSKEKTPTFLFNYRYKMYWEFVLAQQHLNINLLIDLSEIYRKSRAKNTKNFWDAVSRYEKIDDEYVEAYKRFINFTELSKNPNITPETIDKFIYRLNPSILINCVKIPKELIIKYKDYFKNA